MKKYENGKIVEMTNEEIKELERQQAEQEALEKHRPLSESEVFAMLAKKQINTLEVDDDTALRMTSFYPTWEELSDAKFKAERKGFKFTYGGDLYKTKNPEQQFLPNWIPGQGTESIFERIDETHDGTKEDPIPFKTNMEVFKGKYYTEDGILYLCKEDSKQALQHKASQLPRYFEAVK